MACSVEDCSRCSQTVYISLSPESKASLDDPKHNIKIKNLNEQDLVRVMLGWGEMPNNWDLLAYQVGLEEPKERCLLSSVNSCVGSIGPVDQADSYGMETMTLASTSDTYLVYVKNSCGIPYSTVAASHITITDGEDTKKTYLDVPIYNQEIYWLIGCIRQDLNLQQTFQF